MPSASPAISHGPEPVEHLFACAGLTEREADAVRSVALSMTAAEAALFMGVSASTVGSYRQRAYAKLGVAGRAEFLRLPSVAAWRRDMDAVNQEPAGEKEVLTEEVSADDNAVTAPVAVPFSGRMPDTERKSSASLRPYLGWAVLIALAGFVCVTMLLPKRSTYSERPHGTIVTEAGEVPDVVGMRADSAASQLATAGYCPVFVSRADGAAPGTVLEVGQTGDMDELSIETSSFSWGDGCTAGYNVGGDWDAYVELVVAV